jgi:mRNA interferase HigB
MACVRHGAWAENKRAKVPSLGTLLLTIKREQDTLGMRVIAKKALRKFWEVRPDSEQQLKAWHREAKAADWSTPNDVKAQYGKASILQDGRVVFNICGNKYRLVVRINYDFGIIYIRFIGTHKKYDAIDAETI